MVDLSIAVAASLIIGILFKVAARLGSDRFQLLTANYVVALVIALVFAGRSEGVLSPGVVGLGVATGAIFIAGYYLFALATLRAGMSLSLAVMRLSVVIPFVVSWLAFSEPPSFVQQGGLLLACVSIVLISRVPEEGGPKRSILSGTTTVLVTLFVLGGMADVSMKLYEELWSMETPRPFFFSLVFGTASMIGAATSVAALARRRVQLDPRGLLLGVAIGIFNYVTVEFLVRAIGQMPGTLVFPLNSISIVAFGAIIGAFIWREQLSPTNWAGIAGACVALALIGA